MIAKRFSGTNFANLINILADKMIIPEFILENCHEILITPVALYLMQHPDETKAQVDEAQKYLLNLKPAGDMTPSEKAAETVLSVI
jgi:lipid A disaccharide synthetase